MDSCPKNDILCETSLVSDTTASDHIRILLATDMHVGYGERIINRELDSIRTLEEVLKIARDQKVDFILLGGDLYHENIPSREMQLRVTRLLRRYCLNDRPVALNFLSDPTANFNHSLFPNVNYEDSNINVGLPVFTIHGNHDDLTGKGLSALDVLHESGLINLFGKFEAIDEFTVSPLLMKKGKTNLAIYGIGSQRDDRLCRAFKEEKIRFLRPKSDAETWFNILVLHQNRCRRSQDRSTGAYLPESLIPTFFDLVIWGHEHECKIAPQYYESGLDVCGDGFYIIQPGSTIATSLSPEEAIPKHVAVITISGRKFFSTPIRLETPRQILFADLTLEIPPPRGVTKTRRLEKMPDEKIIAEKVEEMLKEGKRSRGKAQPQLPLLRLRVIYPESWANVMKLQCRRFGTKYADDVANPAEMITIKVLRAKTERKKMQLDSKLYGAIEKTTSLEEIINRQFSGASGAARLTVLTSRLLNEVIKSQVEVDEGRKRKEKPLLENISAQKEKLVEALCKIEYKKNGANMESLEELVVKDIQQARDVRLEKMAIGEDNF